MGSTDNTASANVAKNLTVQFPRPRTGPRFLRRSVSALPIIRMMCTWSLVRSPPTV